MTRRRDDEDDGEDEAPVGRRLAIGLEHQRFRHLSWMGFGIVAGILLVWKLGTVAQWVGVGLILGGVVASYLFARTLLYPAGTIVVDDGGVELPRGLCKGAPAKFKLAEVAHVYLLRRAVPWTRAAPVLVVEAGGQPYTYPRDWFLTEADQRRVVRELHARGSGRSPTAAAGGDTYAGPRWWPVDPAPVHQGAGLGPRISGKARDFELHAGGIIVDGKEVRFADAELLGSSYTEYAMDRRQMVKVLAYEYTWQRKHDDQVEQMRMRDEVPAKATRTGAQSDTLRMRSGDTTLAIPAAQIARVQLGVFLHRFPELEAAYERGETVTFGPVTCSCERLTAGDTRVELGAIRSIRLEGGNVLAIGPGKPTKLAHWGEIPNASLLLALLNVVVGLEVDSETGKVEVDRKPEPSSALASEPA